MVVKRVMTMDGNIIKNTDGPGTKPQPHHKSCSGPTDWTALRLLLLTEMGVRW